MQNVVLIYQLQFFQKLSDSNVFMTGVGHGDDLMYLFNMPCYFDDREKEMVVRMTTLYTDFAKYGYMYTNEEKNCEKHENKKLI